MLFGTANLSNLRLIEQVARWITCGGYSLLLWKWVRWLNVFDAPLFGIYLALMIVDIVGAALFLQRPLLIEPYLLSLRFCCLLEAVRLCFSLRRHRQMRLIVLQMLCVGLLGIVVAGAQRYLFDATFYRALRQYVHIGLALAAIGGIIYALSRRLQIEREPRTHFLILMGHFLIFAGLGFLRRAGPGEGIYFREVRIWYFALSCVCIALWLRAGPLFSFKDIETAENAA